MAWNEIASTTLAAVQGSIAVLLIMAYGYGTRSYGLLSHKGERDISTLVTMLCLPALLFTGIGPSVTASTIFEYWTIIAYSMITQLVSYVYALLCLKFSIFESPLWTGACLFNNVISLPLLMLESLSDTNALDGIAGLNKDGAVARAKSYILVYALCSHLTSFVFGPRLMSGKPIGHSRPPSPLQPITEFDNEEHIGVSENESTRLLPGPPRRGCKPLHFLWGKLKSSMNPPLFGGLIAIVVGVIPPFHSMLLDNKGFFRGSLTHSLVEIGKLYASLQMLVVGAQIYSSSHVERGDGVAVSKLSILALFTFRFFLVPLLTISFIYGLRLWKPSILPKDPMFDFALMIVPVGPPAIHLAAIAELAKLSEREKGIISQILMLSYVFTPIISVSISATLSVVEKEGIVYAIFG